MTVRRMAARATANFERNLEDIGAFLSDAGAAHEFERLIEHLSDDIIPTLERFPDLGSEFLVRSPLSAKGRALFERVARLAGSKLSVRQLVDDDYIVLYAVQSETIVLLSIRHQRQLSFDFGGHWP